MPDQLKLGPGDTVRFYAALDDGRRSPSTWRVWMPTNSSDVYIASRHLAGIMKTSLHESGRWQTSFNRDDLMPADNTGLAPSRHLDRWARPNEFVEGYTQALTIICPWTELVPWQEEGVPPGTLRLMMEENCALSVEMLLLRPVTFPVPLHFTDSIIFAAFDLGNDNEFVLVSRKIPWTEADVQMLKEQKAGASASSRSFRDPRQDKRTSEDVSHIKRTTMFRTSERGHRYILDASSWTTTPITGELSQGRLAQSNGARHRHFCEDVTEPLIGERQHVLNYEFQSESAPRSVGEVDGEGQRGVVLRALVHQVATVASRFI